MSRWLILAAIPAGIYLLVSLLAWAMQDRLIYPASQERFEPGPGYREVTLDTSDGLALRAFARAADPGKPTLVYFHGNGGTLAGNMAANEAFAQAGYGLLLVDYRGYGSNPGAPSEQGFYRDGRAAMGWLAGQGIAPGDTIIAANSIGGGTAVQMASEYRVRALVLVAPFTSLPDRASEVASWLPVRWLLRDDFDNAAKLPKLDMPILIQHGTADKVVPFAHGETLSKLNPQVTFERFDGMGHELAFQPLSQQARLAWVEALAGQ